MNIKSLIKTQVIIFWAMFLGSAATISAAVYLVSNNIVETNPQENEKLYLILVPAICITLVLGNIIYSRRQIKVIKAMENIQSKMEKYHQLAILRMILMEFAVVFSTAIFLVNGNKSFSYVALAMILLLRLNKPSEHKLNQELEITENESNKF